MAERQGMGNCRHLSGIGNRESGIVEPAVRLTRREWHPERFRFPIPYSLFPIILCSYANAIAAARDGTSSFTRMLLTWRSTVRSLTDRRVAIALLVQPSAMSRSPCRSRGDSFFPAVEV